MRGGADLGEPLLHRLGHRLAQRRAARRDQRVDAFGDHRRDRLAGMGRGLGRGLADPDQSFDQLGPGLAHHLRRRAVGLADQRRPRPAISPRRRARPRAAPRARRRAPRAGARCSPRSPACARPRPRPPAASPPSARSPPRPTAAVRSAWISTPAIAGGISSRSCPVTSARAAPSASARPISSPDCASPASISRCSACAVARSAAINSASRAFCSSPLAPIWAIWLPTSSIWRAMLPSRVRLAWSWRRQPAGEHLDLLAGEVEPLGEAARGLRAGLLERRPALLDHRQHRLALRLEAGARLVDRLRRSRHRAVDRGLHLRRGLVHPARRRFGAALDPGDMGAEPLRRAAGALVGLARPRAQRRELAFERGRLLVRAEARLLHRLGGGARLRLGLGQVAHQHADIDPRRFGGAVERLRLAVELGGLARRDAG